MMLGKWIGYRSGLVLLCFFLIYLSLAMGLVRSRCRKCPPGWGVVKRCTNQEGTLCQRCNSGETYSSQSSRKSPCRQCSRCGVGLYEAHKCSSTRDTICDDCTNLMYKPVWMRNDDFREKCKYLNLVKKKARGVPGSHISTRGYNRP